MGKEIVGARDFQWEVDSKGYIKYNWRKIKNLLIRNGLSTYAADMYWGMLAMTSMSIHNTLNDSKFDFKVKTGSYSGCYFFVATDEELSEWGYCVPRTARRIKLDMIRRGILTRIQQGGRRKKKYRSNPDLKEKYKSSGSHYILAPWENFIEEPKTKIVTVAQEHKKEVLELKPKKSKSSTVKKYVRMLYPDGWERDETEDTIFRDTYDDETHKAVREVITWSDWIKSKRYQKWVDDEQNLIRTKQQRRKAREAQAA